MSLTPGTRLGPYELLAKLGAGGMGEVYRAKDTRLGRTVAIKVLPPDTAADASARTRFEREARAIAALSHPHICVVHDVGREGDTDYLVMELLDGETLGERLAKAKGPLPLDQVLSIGTAIADALDVAHRAGIVHRDLKPANVMLTRSGPKLLDFGLAKLHGGSGGSGQPGGAVAMSDAGTASTLAPGTAHGTILGSLHYMAPEQVEGRAADARADIWALGALLYEMATGARPFDGESAASVLGAILKDTPAPLSTRQPLTPPAFEHIVDRCLAKDPDDRWQSVRDVKRELMWVAAHSSSGTSPTAPSQTSGVPPAYRPARLATWGISVIAGLAIAALAVPATEHLRESKTEARELRLEVSTPVTGDLLSFALSPDGRQVAFVASADGVSRLWLRPLGSTAAQPLAGTENAAFPFWSPDSRSIAFFAPGYLHRLDLDGGVTRTLTPLISLGRGGTWNEDGDIVFSPSATSALVRVSASGGTPVPVTTLKNQASHRFPTFLPDGRHFVYFAQGGPETSGVFLAALGGGEPVRLTPSSFGGTYLPGPGGQDGWVLWARGTSLVAQRLDARRAILTGEPTVVNDVVATDASTSRTAVSVSRTGLVAYRTGRRRNQLNWFDRSGERIGSVGGPDETSLVAPRLAPDGKRVAAYRTVMGNTDIWLLGDIRESRVTFDAANDRFPVWSPDGRTLTFDSSRTGVRNLYAKAVDGAGAEALIEASQQTKSATDWSPDGKFLLYQSIDPSSSLDLWIRPMNTDAPARPWLKTPAAEEFARFSRDGRFVAYMSNESGRFEVYVQPFTEQLAGSSRARWQVSTEGGICPVWAADGRELYYLDLANRMVSVPVATTGETASPGSPSPLFPTRTSGDPSFGAPYDVSHDGRFLINTVLDEVAAPITVVVNPKF